MKKEITYPCLLTAFSCIIMTLVDSVWQPGYFLKSAIKILFFLILPVVLFFRNRRCIRKPAQMALLTGGVLAITTLTVILGAYYLLGPWLDLSGVPAALESSAGVTKENFLFVGTYIALCNSFLEEFFFRRFAYLELRKTASATFANIFSAAAFSIYHVGMLITMIQPLLFVLAIAALFLCGLLFNYLDSRQDQIWVSWLVHMAANIGINLVGMHLLGII